MTEPQFYRTDCGNAVRFEWTAAENAAASKRAGRPIHDKVLRAVLTAPGLSKSENAYELERWQGDVLIRSDKTALSRFGKQIDAWKAGQTSPDLSGTPIAEWSALDAAQIANLRAMNIHTVEAVAEMTDQAIASVGMGARSLRERAGAFLGRAKDSALAERLAAEKAEQAEQIADLRAQVAAMSRAIEDMNKFDQSAVVDFHENGLPPAVNDEENAKNLREKADLRARRAANLAKAREAKRVKAEA